MERSDSSPKTTRSLNKDAIYLSRMFAQLKRSIGCLLVHIIWLACGEIGYSFLDVMQNLNIDRSIAQIEEKLRGRHCLKDLVILAKEHPESINRFISLAEAIEDDLNSRGLEFWMWIISRRLDSCYRSQRELYCLRPWLMVDDAFFVMTNVSAMVPKGKFSIAFCDTCFYLDASSRQIRIDYSK